MDRRAFLQAALGVSVGQIPAVAGSAYFLLENYYLRNTAEVACVQQFLKRRLHIGPAICLEALVAAHLPQVACLMSFDSAGAMALPPPPFEHVSNTLLRAIAQEHRLFGSPLYELRVCRSPAPERVHPILRCETISGAGAGAMTCLIPFPSLAARAKAWREVPREPARSVSHISLWKSTAYLIGW
jgi:hypothetical protein